MSAEAWTVHSAQRWMRQDAWRFAAPPYPRTQRPLSYVAMRNDFTCAREFRAACALDILLRGLLSEAERSRRLARLKRKDWQDQPRAPAGTPEGGQWVEAGGDAGAGASAEASVDAMADAIFSEASDWSFTDYDSEESEDHDDLEVSDVRKRGHHYVPKQIFDKEELKPETRRVFDEDTTGKLRVPESNYNDKMHQRYNEAVRENYDAYLARNGVRSEDLTPVQARAFLDEVKTSQDPRIRNFNMRLLLREIMYWGRSRPE